MKRGFIDHKRISFILLINYCLSRGENGTRFPLLIARKSRKEFHAPFFREKCYQMIWAEAPRSVYKNGANMDRFLPF